MEIKQSEESYSNCLSSSKDSAYRIVKRNDNQDTHRTISTINDLPKKSHEELRNEKINELNEDFKKCFENHEYEKGITIVKKLIFFNPNNYRNYANMADIYIKIYDLSSAITYMKKSISLQSDTSNIKKLESLLFAKGLINLENGKINKEILLSIKQDLNKNHYHYLKALAFLSVNRKEESLRELEKILKNDSSNLESLLLKGKIYLYMGNYIESGKHFWKVNQINPNHTEIKQYVSIMRIKMQECLQKAHLNVIKNKYRMGILWCGTALSIYPNHPEALLTRSAIKRKLGNYDEAISDLNIASQNMNIDNCHESVIKQICITYNEFALNLMSLGNYKEALRFIDEALRYKNDDYVLHLNRGECLVESKDLNRGLEEYLTCLTINPLIKEAKLRVSIIYYKLAIVCFNNKEYIECIKNMDLAIVHFCDTSEYYVLRARAHLKINEITKAYEDVKKALDMNPKNIEAIEIKKYLS